MAQTIDRNKTIDIIRGLAMICVVLGHCGFPYTQHLYLFHMGVFIFISGYCFNKKNSDSLNYLKSYFGRKMISLYLPYAIFTAIFLLLFNWLIEIGILSDNPSAKTPVEYRVWWKTLNGILSSFHFEGYAAEQLCGAAWFVIVLIEIVFFFSILCWILKLFIRNEHNRNVIILSVSLYFLWLGNYFRVHNLNLNDFLATSCSCLILYTSGYLVREYIPRNVLNWKLGQSVIVIILSIAGLYLEEKKGHISLGSNSYPTPSFMIICTVTGLLLLFALSDLIRRIPWVDKAIAYIGQHTMFILFLHFTAFKIVNLIQVWLYKKEWYELATFPHLETEHGWWIAYTFAGIIVPIMINWLWEQVERIAERIDDKTSIQRLRKKISQNLDDKQIDKEKLEDIVND